MTPNGSSRKVARHEERDTNLLTPIEHLTSKFKKRSPRIAPTTTTMMMSKIIRPPPLRFIGIVFLVLFAVAASSLALLPSPRRAGGRAARRTAVGSIHPTTPSLFFTSVEHSDDHRGAGQWTGQTRRTHALSRGSRRWLSTALVTSTTTATEGQRVEIVTASEWRRLAGFQFQQQDDSGAAGQLLPLKRANDAEEAVEIKRLQEQARAVANMHVVSSSATAYSQPATTIHSADTSSSRGEGIHLKKELVTSVFSKPAVVHRRRSSSSSTTTEAAVEVPSISTHTRKSDSTRSVPLGTTEKQDSEASSSVPPVSVQEEINFASRRAEKHEESHSLSRMTTVPAAVPDTASVSTRPVVTMSVEEAPMPSQSGKAEVQEPVPMANSLPLTRTPGSDATTSTTSTTTKRKWTALTTSKLSDRVRRLRSQPKSAMVESILQARYAAIPDVGMRAYQILCDLEMVVPTPHPNDPNYDASCDDELAPENNYIR